MLRLAKRPWLWILLLFLFCLGLAITAYFVLGSREPLVSETNVQRIKVGMSEADVKGVLGEPPGGLSVRPHFIPGPARMRETFYWDESLLRRSKDALVVAFDNDGVVDRCWIAHHPPDDRSVWERLRDRVAEMRASHGW
jgi:hypothetical protein